MRTLPSRLPVANTLSVSKHDMLVISSMWSTSGVCVKESKQNKKNCTHTKGSWMFQNKRKPKEFHTKTGKEKKECLSGIWNSNFLDNHLENSFTGWRGVQTLKVHPQLNNHPWLKEQRSPHLITPRRKPARPLDHRTNQLAVEHSSWHMDSFVSSPSRSEWSVLNIMHYQAIANISVHALINIYE